jgi:hypothetical protein
MVDPSVLSWSAATRISAIPIPLVHQGDRGMLNSPVVQFTLYAAATLVLLVGIVHSWLGERVIIMPLLAIEPRQGPLKSAFIRKIIRFAWHITTLAWLGLALVLLALLPAPVGEQGRMIALIIAATFFVSGLISLIISKGRHIAWPLFFLIAVLALTPLL